MNRFIEERVLSQGTPGAETAETRTRWQRLKDGLAGMKSDKSLLVRSVAGTLGCIVALSLVILGIAGLMILNSPNTPAQAGNAGSGKPAAVAPATPAKDAAVADVPLVDPEPDPGLEEGDGFMAGIPGFDAGRDGPLSSNDISSAGDETIAEGEYYFRGLERVDNSGLDPVKLAAVRAGLYKFDGLVRDMAGKYPVVARAGQRDLDPGAVLQFYDVWSYIRAVTNKYMDSETSMRTAASIILYARRYNLPIGLVMGVAQTESNFKPTAYNDTGAAGPMQVIWKIHYGLLNAYGYTGMDDLKTPEKGIAAGCLLLSRYLKKEKSIPGALKRYYGELSARYVGKVYSHWHSYELMTSGASNDWREIVTAELNQWKKLTGVRVSTPKISGTPVKTQFPGTPVKKAAQPAAKEPETPAAGTTVYMSGSIRIQKANGTVLKWSSEEQP
jgi:hypothetical protein